MKNLADHSRTRCLWAGLDKDPDPVGVRLLNGRGEVDSGDGLRHNRVSGRFAIDLVTAGLRRAVETYAVDRLCRQQVELAIRLCGGLGDRAMDGGCAGKIDGLALQCGDDVRDRAGLAANHTLIGGIDDLEVDALDAGEDLAHDVRRPIHDDATPVDGVVWREVPGRACGVAATDQPCLEQRRPTETLVHLVPRAPRAHGKQGRGFSQAVPDGRSRLKPESAEQVAHDDPMRNLTQQHGQKVPVERVVGCALPAIGPIVPARGQQSWQQLAVQVRGLRIQVAKHLRPVDPYSGSHPHIVGARPWKHEGDVAARAQGAGCIEDPLAAVHGGGRFGEQAALAHRDSTLEIGAPGGVERQSEGVVVRPRRLHDVPPPRQGFNVVCGAVLRVGGEPLQRRQTGL